MATGYVTNWGNDENDGLTWETAKRTFQSAKNAGNAPNNAKGWFNESVTGIVILGNSQTTLDGSFIGTNAATQLQCYDSIITKFTTRQDFRNFIRCVVFNNYGGNFDMYGGWVKESVFYNNQILNTYSSSRFIHLNTFHNTTAQIQADDTYETRSIFSNLDLTLQNSYCTYSLFINCSFKFIGGTEGANETIWTVPTGATDADKMQNLRDRMAVVHGGIAAAYLTGCLYYSGSYNDIFVDADNGDFSLVPNCIAAHMSFNGDYVGARKEGVKADWNTDFTNIVNIGTPGRILDQDIDSTVETNIIDLGHVRNVTNLISLGQRAARNGQQINTESNLGTEINAGSDVLTDGLIYQCIDDTITLDDGSATSRIPWETFIAVEEGTPGNGDGLGFSGDGKVQEVYADGRHDQKIQFKTSKTDPTLATATTVTCFLHNSPVMVNVDGNGEPTYGDADPGYILGNAIPLYTRYIKYYIKIKANNLPART